LSIRRGMTGIPHAPVELPYQQYRALLEVVRAMRNDLRAPNGRASATVLRGCCRECAAGAGTRFSGQYRAEVLTSSLSSLRPSKIHLQQSIGTGSKPDTKRSTADRSPIAVRPTVRIIWHATNPMPEPQAVMLTLPPHLQSILDAEYPRFSAGEMARRRMAAETLLAEVSADHLIYCGANRFGSAVQWLTQSAC
jgi:hypothetical protein